MEAEVGAYRSVEGPEHAGAGQSARGGAQVFKRRARSTPALGGVQGEVSTVEEGGGVNGGGGFGGGGGRRT